MILAARRSAAVISRDRNVERVLRRRAVTDLVRLAQEILLLDPRFDRAFPRERSRASAPGLEAAARRLLANDASTTGLPTLLRSALDRWCAPPDSRSKAKAPSALARFQLADQLLTHALKLQPDSSMAHVVRAQRAWLFGTDLDRTRRSLERACECASTRASAASALVHLAILRADQGQLDEAIELLRVSSRHDPGSFAISWTLGVYALASGRGRLVERQLQAISRTADPASLRRRGLALPGHLTALARSGVLPASSTRARAEAFLSRLPPIHVVRNRP